MDGETLLSVFASLVAIFSAIAVFITFLGIRRETWARADADEVDRMPAKVLDKDRSIKRIGWEHFKRWILSWVGGRKGLAEIYCEVKVAEGGPLKEKILKMAELEKKYNISGVSFATRKAARTVSEQDVDYVIEAIKLGIRILEQKDYVVVSCPAPPR